MRSSENTTVCVLLWGLAGVLVISLLTGCATTTDTAATDAGLVCEAWRPVTWSTTDTDQTIREAKANNAARAAWGCND